MIDPENRVTRMQRQVMRIQQKLARKRMQRCPHCHLFFRPEGSRLHAAAHAAIADLTIAPVPDHVPEEWSE